MRVPYGWLQEFVPMSLSIAEISGRLTMAGFEVEETLEIDGETVLDVHVNANRGDALSMLGIAREVSALSGTPLTPPMIHVDEEAADVHTLARVMVDAPDLCPRYAARVICGITIGPSPDWVQRRLLAMGVRPINNVVDATNYVMLELGQPLHAFDLDMLHAQTIIVRRARAGESFRTLDGVDRQLTEDMLVIADGARPVALAGIMGGENSEVTANTVNLLLESAHFERTSIRKTARAHGLSTESSYRFERIVDPAGVVQAVDRVAQLIVDWAGGRVASGVVDVKQPLPDQRTITMPVERVNYVLGTDIAMQEIIRVLRSLQLEVALLGTTLQVGIPSFRPDLLEEMDLIEEVARIYGYEHVPTTVPGKIDRSGRLAPELAFEARVRRLLVSAGLYESVSFSLIDIRMLDLLQLPDEAEERTQVVALRNPKSEEFTHLRPSMLLTMLDALRNNARRNIEDVQLFEIGRIFRAIGGGLRFDYARHDRRLADVRVQDAERLPLESRSAGLALMGRPWSSRWGGGDTEIDFYWVKGLLEGLFSDLNISCITFRPWQHASLHPGRSAAVYAGECRIATLGEIHPRVANNFDLPRRAYVAEVNIDELMDVSGTHGVISTLSRFPAISRDIAFLYPVVLPAADAQSCIIEAAGAFLESVSLFDVYVGSHVPDGQRSLAYRLTFRAEDRTLADEEVDAMMQKVRGTLRETVGAIFR